MVLAGEGFSRQLWEYFPPDHASANLLPPLERGPEGQERAYPRGTFRLPSLGSCGRAWLFELQLAQARSAARGKLSGHGPKSEDTYISNEPFKDQVRCRINVFQARIEVYYGISHQRQRDGTNQPSKHRTSSSRVRNELGPAIRNGAGLYGGGTVVTGGLVMVVCCVRFVWSGCLKRGVRSTG